MDVLPKETFIENPVNADSTDFIRQGESLGERPSSAVNALQMEYSSSDIERVEGIFKYVDIVLLREHLDRRIFREEQYDEHGINRDGYQLALHVGTLQCPICVTEFDTFDECRSYVQACTNKRIFLIIPSALNMEKLSIMKNSPQISLIYELDLENLWTATKFGDDLPLFKNLLCQLKKLFSWIDDDETTLHPLTEQDIGAPLKDVDNDSRIFIVYQLLVEIIIRSSRSNTDREHFIDYAHQIFSKKGRFENDIGEFSSNFTASKAIHWYTRPSFVYRLLSRTCCSNNIQNIFKIRYFICNLFDQLKELHEESLLRFHENLEVYRGKVVTNEEFLKIMKSLGNLVITKTFLSTTIDREIALQFAGDDLPEDKVGVIFHMIINTKINQTKPFAYIASKSCNPDEKEVLMSIGTVFRIVLIKEITNTVWEVILSRDDDEDRLESSILDRFFPSNSDNQTNNINSMLDFLRMHDNEESNATFIQLMWNHLCLFDLTAAGENRQTDENDQRYKYATPQMNTGIRRLSSLQNTLEIQKKTFPPTHPNLASSYNNIGNVYRNMVDYPKALTSYEKALAIRQQSRPPNHPDLAMSYNNIGNVYQNMGDYQKALSCHEKALAIRQQSLPPNHPDLASSYNNIGSMYQSMGDYPKALSSYEKALAIWQQSLPPNHPDLASSYNNIGTVYRNMGDYPKALSSYEKALAIRQRSLPPNHPDWASSYTSIGTVYQNMGDYPKALTSYEKDLEISQKSLPPNHPDLASSNNNMGAVYQNMGDYPKALSCHEKALAIQQRSLRPNHPALAMSYNNIGIVYQNMSDNPKALSSYEKALAIRQQSLPPNHPDLASSYNNIGSMYQNMGDYLKALSCHEKALVIKQQSLPPNHPDFAISHFNIGLLHENMGNYSKACASYERALQIGQKSLPSNHPHLQKYQEKVANIEKKL